MKAKRFVFGVLIATLVAVPSITCAFAKPNHSNSHAHSGHGRTAPIASAFVCDSDDQFISDGAYARWTTGHGASPTFTFGSVDTLDEFIGLRISAAGLPAKSFQLDWDTRNSYRPLLNTWLDTPTGIFSWDFLQIESAPGAFESITELANGFTRYVLTAESDDIPEGSGWNTIYFLDTFDGDGYSSQIRNVFVNGIPVQIDTRKAIQQDCTNNFG